MSEPRSDTHPPVRRDTSRRWAGPALLAAFLVVPVVVFIVSNTDRTPVSWAGWTWEAPGWIVLLVTFAVGVLFGKVLGWAWRGWRKRRRAEAHAADITRK